MNSNNSNNNEIFINKIWNNIYIQKNIKYYLKLYNCFRYNQHIHLYENTLDKLKSNQYLEYFKSITIYDIKKQNYQQLLKVLGYLKSFNQIESITLFQEDLLNTQLKELLDEFTNIDCIVFQETTIPLSFNILSSNVKNVIFEFLDYNQSLSTIHHASLNVTSIFPTVGLKSLTLGLGFNSSLLPGTLPSTLKNLTFNVDYNQPLQDGSLPTGLESIVFGTSFNQPLIYLPTSLLELTLGTDFNQNIQGYLPKSLKKFINNGNFSEPIIENSQDSLFPNSIEVLELYSFIGDNYIFKLPTSLKSLTISNNYFKNNSINFMDNKNLVKISITSNNLLMYNSNNSNNNSNNNNNDNSVNYNSNRLNNYQFNFFKIDNSYSNLKKIELNSTLSLLFQDNKDLIINSLKEDISIQSIDTLKVLIIKSGSLDFINSKIKFNYVDRLKINLFGSDIHIEDSILPFNIKSIIFCSKYGHFSLGDSVLLNCNSLTSIHLNSYCKEIKRSMFPDSLLNLELVDFKKQLDNQSIPTSLTSLKLISRYSLNTSILPISLRIFYTNQLPKIQNNKQWLPNHLQYLLIYEKYKLNNLSNINNSNLPDTLKTIYISNLHHDLLYSDNIINSFLKENLDLIIISNKLNSIYKKLINK